MSVSLSLSLSLECVIVPLRECKQPDVFASLASLTLALAKSLHTSFWLLLKVTALSYCVFATWVRACSPQSLKRNLHCARMSVKVTE